MKRSVVVVVVLSGAAFAAFCYFGKARIPTPALAVTPKAAVVPAAPAPKPESEVLLDQALADLRGGDSPKAQAGFAAVISRFPTEPAGARAAVESARLYVKGGDYASARNTMVASLNVLPDGASRGEVLTELTNLNNELIFSRKAGPDSIEYAVRPGDSLAKIGQRFKITAGFIKRINYLNSDRLSIGGKLKVFQGPFDAVVEKDKFRLTIYLRGQFVKEYRVGLGKDNSTPAGEYAVRDKLVNPVWCPPGGPRIASGAPDNPLGTRWITFDKEYGIHGTIEPDSIGKMESHGCVRMLNSDVEEVYDLLVAGSKVTVK